MNDENPFDSPRSETMLKRLLANRLVKRITIIEGNYPTSKEQHSFLQRIIDWFNGKQSD